MDENQSEKNQYSAGRRLTHALLLIGIGTLVYLNSFEGSFVLDDFLYLNATQRNLWQAMFTGSASRPLIGFTLYLNYVISGYEDWSYHLLNLLVHLFATLCLYGIVRQTLLSDKLVEMFGKRSATLAFLIALIWMVHPLQTQSVTYMIQRCESIMGLFYLLTLYCAIRSFTSARKGAWYAAAILACIGGMLSKQVMVTAPVMVLLYDYLFVSDSLKSALQQRWRLYVGLAATWGILVLTTVISPVNATAGFSVQAISPMDYFLSEFKVIIQYLKLAFYPVGLSVDYGWQKATGMKEVLPFAIPVLLMQGATLWGIYRRKMQAFPGAWFFGILAVTSSVMPFSDLVFEHRMYLSLAAVVTAVVLGADWLLQRLLQQYAEGAPDRQRAAKSFALVMVTLLVLVLGVQTVRRNMDYRSEFVLWTDNVNKQPGSPRAQINLGKLLVEQGLAQEALAHFTEGLKVLPDCLEGRNNMGWALLKLGRVEEAKEHLLIAAAQNSDADVHFNLGDAFLRSGEIDKAIEQFSKSIELRKNFPSVHYLLGIAYVKQGRFEEALECFNTTLQIDAMYVDALNEKALLLIGDESSKVRNPQEAMVCAMQSIAISKKRYGRSFDVLGRVYAEAGRYPEAINAARQATMTALAMQDKEFARDATARLKSYLEKVKDKAAKT
jgi:tetratricopeptide (TPR) repeat protein